MVKDRTMQLRQGASTKKKGSLRASGAKKRDEEMVVLTLQSSNPVITSSSKSKDTSELGSIFSKVREITELVESMKENIVDLRKLHAKIQTSPRIDSKTRERETELNEAFKSSCWTARKMIKELKPSTKKDHITQPTAVNRVKQTQYSLLVKQLKDTASDYETCLSKHNEISKKMIKQQLHIVVQMVLRKMPCVPADVEASEDDLMAMLDTQDLAVFVQDYVRDTNEAIQSLQDARERHKEILALEKNIEQLRDMMTEIAISIYQQGDMVDKIEFHIGKGVDMTEQTQKRLSKVHKMVIRARKKKVYIIICLTSVVAIFLLYTALQIALSRQSS